MVAGRHEQHHGKRGSESAAARQRHAGDERGAGAAQTRGHADDQRRRRSAACSSAACSSAACSSAACSSAACGRATSVQDTARRAAGVRHARGRATCTTAAGRAAERARRVRPAAAAGPVCSARVRPAAPRASALGGRGSRHRSDRGSRAHGRSGGRRDRSELRAKLRGSVDSDGDRYANTARAGAAASRRPRAPDHAAARAARA